MKQLPAVWLDKATNRESIQLNDKYSFIPEDTEDTRAAGKAKLERLGIDKYEVATILLGGAAWQYIWHESDDLIADYHSLADYIVDNGVQHEAPKEAPEEFEYSEEEMPEIEARDRKREQEFLKEAKHPLFRGKQLSWVNGEKSHLIKWGDKIYNRGDFFKAAYPEYKAQEYGIRFLTQDVKLLTISQRTILMYDFLADQYGVDDYPQEEVDALVGFCSYEVVANEENGTASDTLKKLNMDGGLGKMIKFGVGMKAREAAEQTWCYERHGNKFEGVNMTWEQWLLDVEFRIDGSRRQGSDWLHACRDANKTLYYQNGVRLTLTSADYMEIVDWMKQVYLFPDGDHEVPFHGPINAFEYSFVLTKDDVSFETKTERVTKFFKENAADLQKKSAQKKVENGAARKLSGYKVGVQLTTADLHAVGFNANAITRLVKNGVLSRLKRGVYVLETVF